MYILPPSEKQNHPTMKPVVIDVPGIHNIIDNFKQCPTSGDNLINSKLLKVTSYLPIALHVIRGWIVPIL